MDVPGGEILVRKVVCPGPVPLCESLPEKGVARSPGVHLLERVQEVLAPGFVLGLHRVCGDAEGGVSHRQPVHAFADGDAFVAARKAHVRDHLFPLGRLRQLEHVAGVPEADEAGIGVHHPKGSNVEMAVEGVPSRSAGNLLVGVVCGEVYPASPEEGGLSVAGVERVDAGGDSYVVVRCLFVVGLGSFFV